VYLIVLTIPDIFAFKALFQLDLFSLHWTIFFFKKLSFVLSHFNGPSQFLIN